jgi:hypothetical protein
MNAIADALRHGLRAVRRNAGLALLLFVVNVGFAALLAVPLAGILERDLASTDAAAEMMYGSSFPWWSRFSDAQRGWTESFSPEILGIGFAYRNVEALLQGQLPLGLFASGEDRQGRLDPVILGIGALYLLLQIFLGGGLLVVFRSPESGWKLRGLLHGSGFYFGRFVRIALLALACDGLLFWLNAPLARWVDGLAIEAVSETTAMALALGRHALLLLALLFVHLVSSYAKVITVVEERGSALLAFLSSVAFCLGNLLRTAGHFLAIIVLGAAAVVAWNALDSRWETTGYKTQVVALLLAQGLVIVRLGLRLGLLAGQVALFRRLTSGAGAGGAA